MTDSAEVTVREADANMAARFISESDGDFPELSALFARHAAQARLEAIEEAAQEWEPSLAWIKCQAKSIMRMTEAMRLSDLVEHSNSTASDIAINAEMLADKLRNLSTRGDQK